MLYSNAIITCEYILWAKLSDCNLFKRSLCLSDLCASISRLCSCQINSEQETPCAV